ncbi:MAG: serine/threonine protein kinase, partial [bacterium]
MIILSGYQSVTKLYDSKYSIIYRGYRKEDQLPVIFKLLKKEYPSIEELARFQREYEMTRSLNLEGVIQVYALEKHENSLVMVLEDFEGESLSDILKSQPLSLSEKLQLSIRITHIVGAIHQQHIIHKDINPSNIIWNRNTNQLKFIDFGISTELSFDIPEICNPNILEGTLPYISPEQTGRMNRSVDYRSDLYSLGVTLYKIFTEKLPFSSNDPMELIHEHMARIPQPLHELKATIPTAITHIILQLMQKNAESRYQTAFGLEHDLQHCFDQMKNGFHIQLFQLGKCDISDKFQIPEKLYGREYEIKTLLSAFDQVSCGTTQMMLIAGYSGVGKSALVREIHKPIIAKKGYFIDGKFDQFQRNIPYFAMIHAFQELIQELLREPQEQLLAWKEKLLKSLGCNGQVIIDVIPEVELIIGKQKDVTEVEPEETQNRFNMTFQRFIKVFTQKDHPLVLFLDDLQWADSATLKLLYVLMTDVDSQYLFLIGAYRNNEVLSEHLLMETLERIEKEQEKKRVHTLTLSTLKKENLDQ